LSILERLSMSSLFGSNLRAKEKRRKEREEKKWFQQGMNKCTTPLRAVKPLRFP